MRHFNSPEELARRAGTPETPRSKEFRHYNHPEEVAKRAAAGQASSAVVVPPSPRASVASGALTAGEGWPPAGEPNNAPADAPVVVEPQAVAADEKPDTVPPPPRRPDAVESRLRRIETLLWTLVENVPEARHFRMLLNNVEATTNSQQDLINRVRALEQTLEQLGADEGDGGDELGDDGDGEPEALELGGGEPTPTRDLNARPEEA